MLRWADMDSLGHVNNATILTLLEEGRVRLLLDADLPAEKRSYRLVVARNEIDYVLPLYYSLAPVQMRVWVDRLGRSSFTFGSEIEQSGHTVVRARTVVVAVNVDGSGSMPLPDDARMALARYQPR